MLIPLDYLMQKYDMKIQGLLDVGAHFAEEYEDFKKYGVNRFVYFEPCTPAFEFLERRFRNDESVWLFNCACGASKYKAKMFTETVNKGQSNSLLRPKEHLIQHPTIEFNSKEEVFVFPLDDSIELNKQCNFLLLDCQGFEGEVLKGATETLKYMNWVYTEVNFSEVYEGCALAYQINDFLFEHGFIPVEESRAGNWGDRFFKRPDTKSTIKIYLNHVV